MVRPPKPESDWFGLFVGGQLSSASFLIPRVKEASVWWNPEPLELKGCFSGWIKSRIDAAC